MTYSLILKINYYENLNEYLNQVLGGKWKDQEQYTLRDETSRKSFQMV